MPYLKHFQILLSVSTDLGGLLSGISGCQVLKSPISLWWTVVLQRGSCIARNLLCRGALVKITQNWKLSHLKLVREYLITAFDPKVQTPYLLIWMLCCSAQLALAGLRRSLPSHRKDVSSWLAPKLLSGNYAGRGKPASQSSLILMTARHRV